MALPNPLLHLPRGELLHADTKGVFFLLESGFSVMLSAAVGFNLASEPRALRSAPAPAEGTQLPPGAAVGRLQRSTRALPGCPAPKGRASSAQPLPRHPHPSPGDTAVSSGKVDRWGHG